MRRIPKFITGLITGIVLSLVVVTGGLAGGFLQEIKVEMRPLKYYFDGVLKGNTNGQYFNGIKNVPLGFIYEGTTYVPLRFMSESLGKEVGYDGEKNRIWVGIPPQESDVKVTVPQGEKTVEAYLGLSTKELVERLGEPQRKDPGEFGFDWWIYNKDYLNYLQVGVKNGKVVAMYTNSRYWDTNGVKVGEKREDIAQQLNLSNTVKFKYGNADFTFSVTGDSFQQRPLKVENNVASEFFFDIHDGNRLTAIRVVQLDSFMEMDWNYSVNLKYSGTKPTFGKPKLSDNELERVERAYERQIFDLANAARAQRGLAIFQWDEKAASVARSHSGDMLINNFFSHTSPNTGDLGNRLKKAGLNYRMAAENIFYNAPDGISAHEGWMNSLGHRKNVLNGELKSLGVGVKGKYYTQNFVTY